uniref:Type II toxin-antitoxin system VapC family toxin n=1 Tax=Heterorhabditis bacteriophora TaxID=37862 RepID=A0A1I7WUD6_HETBA
MYGTRKRPLVDVLVCLAGEINFGRKLSEDYRILGEISFINALVK